MQTFVKLILVIVVLVRRAAGRRAPAAAPVREPAAPLEPIAATLPSEARPASEPPRAAASRWKIAITFGCVVLVLVAAGIAQSTQGRRVLRHLGVTAAPTSYTELFFADPGKLPPVDEPAPPPRRVPFVIHNVGPHVRSYVWTVTENGAFVATGRATVGGGDGLTVAAPVSPPCPSHVSGAGRRFRVQIALTEPSETISFQGRCRG